jgi:hypothetical protein
MACKTCGNNEEDCNCPQNIGNEGISEKSSLRITAQEIIGQSSPASNNLKRSF